MRIERNHSLAPAAEAAKLTKPATSVADLAETDLNESHRLNQALANTTAVRAEQVARAKALVADPNYPSQEQLAKVAGVLVANWQRVN